MSFMRIRHPEWEARTSGALLYARDMALEGALFVRILRCPFAAARLESLDLSAARRAPGVAAIVSGELLPDRNYRDYGQMDRPAMVKERAVYFGQEVVAIAAETEDQARTAIDLISVRWKPLRASTSVDEALRPGAAAVHPDRASDNIATQADRAFGNRDARKKAQRSLAGRYGCGPQHHACMEPSSVVARWDADATSLDIWTPTQSPRSIAGEIAYMLDLQPGQVHLHRCGVGGDFGSRVKTGNLEVIAAHLSIQSNRPVSIRLSREEEFAFAKRQHETWIDVEDHYDTKGHILFREAAVTVDNGAFMQGGSNQMNYCSILLASHYDIDGAAVTGRSIYTNRQPGGAFRGAGGPQAVFAIESQMDEIAADLEMDPIDLRLLNLHEPESETITGWQIATTGAEKCLRSVRNRLDWEAKRKTGGNGRGVGVALAMHVSGAIVNEMTAKAGATIEIGQNGGIQLSSGCADPGTGEYAVIAQLAATELGVTSDRIELSTMDTTTTPYDPGAGSSRATMITGNAVLAVSREMADTLKAQAAEMLGCPAELVVLQEGFARAGEQELPIGTVAAAHPSANGGTLRFERETATEVEPVGMTHTDSGFGNLSPAYAFAAHGVEVEVDTDTGKIKVLKVIAVHDAGTVINPTGAEGQIVGGVVMGLGAALGEQLLWFRGRPHVNGFADYAMARADDAPPIEVEFVGEPDPMGPAGAKSISEIAYMPIAAAVANAVAHAIGKRTRDLPLTPDKVLTALDKPLAVRPASKWGRPRRWRSALVRPAYNHGLFETIDRFGPSQKKFGERLKEASIRPATNTAHAATLLASEASAVPIGGGTDLMATRAADLSHAKILVSLNAIPDLKKVELDSGDLFLGSNVSLAAGARALASSPMPGDRALADVMRKIATPQIREMATIGGNLCQMNRCWFLRSGFDCYKRGGAGRPCYAVLGDHRYFHAVADAGRCQSVTPSDLAVMLCALEAEIEIRGVDGERSVKASAFYVGPGETCLHQGEYVTGIRVSETARARRSTYEKLSLTSDGFAIASAAASAGPDANGHESIHFYLGAVAATPWKAKRSEEYVRENGKADICTASQAWIADCDPLPNNRWKMTAASGLLKRAMEAVL